MRPAPDHMRVAIVHSFYSNSVPSGENTAVHAQHTALQRSGIEAKLVSVATDDLSIRTGYSIRTAINVATGTGISPLEQLKRFEPDVVHVHNLFPNFSTKWLNEWEGPVVATMHNFRSVCAAGTLFRDGNGCFECPNSGSHRAIVHKCYRDSTMATIPLAIRTRGGALADPLMNRANRLLVLSPRSEQIFLDLGITPDKIRLLPNFVQKNEFENNLPGTNWVYFGRLTEEKGIRRLVEEWPQEESLSIYGDGPLRSWLEAHSTNSIQIKGPVPNDEVSFILAQSKGLIFPSEWPENAPMIYVEALSSGLPVVARAGNSVADDVALRGTGATYRNSAELRHALKHVNINRTSILEKVNDCYNNEYSEFAWVRNARAIYKELLTK